MKKALDYIKEFYPKNWGEIDRIPMDDVLEIIDNVLEDKGVDNKKCTKPILSKKKIRFQ